MPSTSPTKPCCRNCEYFDVGGESNQPMASSGDCLNPNSDRFTPEWDHLCRAYYGTSLIDNIRYANREGGALDRMMKDMFR